MTYSLPLMKDLSICRPSFPQFHLQNHLADKSLYWSWKLKELKWHLGIMPSQSKGPSLFGELQRLQQALWEVNSELIYARLNSPNIYCTLTLMYAFILQYNYWKVIKLATLEYRIFLIAGSDKSLRDFNETWRASVHISEASSGGHINIWRRHSIVSQCSDQSSTAAAGSSSCTNPGGWGWCWPPTSPLPNLPFLRGWAFLPIHYCQGLLDGLKPSD